MKENLYYSKLGFKKLHLTYWSLDILPNAVSLAMTMVTTPLLLGALLYDGCSTYVQQRAGELFFAMMMAYIVLIQSTIRMGDYGFQKKRHLFHGRRTVVWEVLLFVVAVLIEVFAMTRGEHVVLSISGKSGVLFNCPLPFSSPVAAVIIPMDFLVVGGCYLWVALAGAADWNNYVNLINRQSEYWSFEEYVRLAAKYAVK